ncbi:Serine/threonine-protein kinase/endoribonuclease IRE1 [Orchesella cincta]|uniref:Serine/threonine-protein kinase/endoribonuclease IRE1 n=1 Tax=Orchesella cincta TaxID=48709 RepID=A0A1D2MCP7_ORCCI|nr:Serine/threonine-protein kinase/endoribonuclease IRE1 [Orchesella cincta]
MSISGPVANSIQPQSTVDGVKIQVDYSLNKIIGQGASSIIYEGNFGPFPAAVKRVKSEDFDIYENELKLWVEMKRTCQEENVHIVTLYFFYTRPSEAKEEPQYFFIMELAKSDLGKRIKDIKKYETEEGQEAHRKKMKGLIHDAAKGLKWIHDSGILHRDIKPENILIFERCGGIIREIAKLADFGVSRKLSGVSTGTNTCGKGTTDWMAPEPLKAIRDKKQFYSTKSIDIFSLGMTAHYAFSLGIHPFEDSLKYGAIKFLNIIDDTIRPAELGPPDYSTDHLLQWMMEKDGNFRPTIHQVLQHPFFWDSNKCLAFLVDVVRSVKVIEKNDHNLMKLREKIDQSYFERMELLKEETSWKQKMNTRLLNLLLQRKTKGKKEYSGESLMMLVELIRDKHMHSDEMQEELISDEFFGDGGSFSDEKYIGYFLNTFPDIITFLFCEMVNEQRNPTISFLRKKYFKEFGNMPLMSA